MKGDFEGVGVRWECNMKIDHNEIGCDVVARINLAEDSDTWRAVVNVAMNLRVQ